MIACQKAQNNIDLLLYGDVIVIYIILYHYHPQPNSIPKTCSTSLGVGLPNFFCAVQFMFFLAMFVVILWNVLDSECFPPTSFLTIQSNNSSLSNKTLHSEYIITFESNK